MTVRIVCDSTADLEAGYRADHSVRVVPLKVIFGDEIFEDSMDLTADEFYARMRTSPVQPRTSQPTPGEFEAVFREASADGSEVVCTTISAGLSGTYASAEAARAALPGSAIHVFDTRSVGPGHSALARVAVETAERGGSAADVLRALSAATQTQRVLFTVETLEYLRRGGRIGGAQALVGSVLSIKPILEMRDGGIEAVDRVRTFARAVDRIADECAAAANRWGGGSITIGHAGVPEVAHDLARRLQAHAVAPIVAAPVSPVIGCHSGPGAVGLSFHRPER